MARSRIEKVLRYETAPLTAERVTVELPGNTLKVVKYFPTKAQAERFKEFAEELGLMANHSEVPAVPVI